MEKLTEACGQSPLGNALFLLTNDGDSYVFHSHDNAHSVLPN